VQNVVKNSSVTQAETSTGNTLGHAEVRVHEEGAAPQTQTKTAEPVATDYSVHVQASTQGGVPGSTQGNLQSPRPSPSLWERTTRAARVATMLATAQPMPMSQLAPQHAAPLHQGAQASQVVSHTGRTQGAVVRTEFSTQVADATTTRTTQTAPKVAEVNAPATQTETVKVSQDSSITDYAAAKLGQAEMTHASIQASMQAHLHEEEMEEAAALAKGQKKKTAQKKKLPNPDQPGHGGGASESTPTVLPEDEIFLAIQTAAKPILLDGNGEPELDKRYTRKLVQDEALAKAMEDSGMGKNIDSAYWKQDLAT
jgi:hypothetical protein